MIGPANLDLFTRALKRAQDWQCGSLLVLLNTPGGSLQTTRFMVEKILNSPLPILCLIAPSGGHAGSAGAILLQACHVNGAMEATNVGAATPVAGGGAELPEDLRKKILNDTRSWMDSITRLRGRNQKFGEDIITEAKAVSASEAKRLGAIDVVVSKVEDFLAFARNRQVKLSENVSAKVTVGERRPFVQDWRYKTLDLLTDPQTAYLMLMGSLALIYFELTHPGITVPGVIGGMGLIISLVALHKLDVEWGGLALIALALALFIAEIFVPSFGVLGLGGIAAFVMGSLFLFDPAETGGYRLPLTLILPTALALGGIMVGVGYLVLKSRRRRETDNPSDLVGRQGVVVDIASDNEREGQLEISGETWRFEAPLPLKIGQRVQVRGQRGLTLLVDVRPEV